ncbi:hypothetical protein TWF481_001853 [Arthrobotrys musiformis]|uniref:CHAT domain-containing protein n=1 Tax=Arthrobotrys musiformis TaxID=47236 RepID=A0AAV9VWA7_9PEZI
MKIARTFIPLPVLDVWQGVTQTEKQDIQLYMDWMLFFVAVYVDVVDTITHGGKSVNTALVELLDEDQFWAIMDGLEHYCFETYELNKLALAYFYIGKLMEVQKKWDDAIIYYEESVDLLKEAHLYGFLGNRRNHLVPEFMRGLKPKDVLERVARCQIKLHRKNEAMRKHIERKRKAYKKELSKFWKNWRMLKAQRDKRRAKRVEKVRKMFGIRRKEKKIKQEKKKKLDPEYEKKVRFAMRFKNKKDVKPEQQNERERIIQYLLDNGFDPSDDDKKQPETSVKEIEYSSSDESENNDKENQDPNARGPRERLQRSGDDENKSAKVTFEEEEEDEEDEAEKQKRAEIREGKKPMTGGRAENPEDTDTNTLKPKISLNSLKFLKKPSAPKVKKPTAPPGPPEGYADRDPKLSDDIWNTVQELKAYEYRRTLGASSLWDDHENLLNELNKIIAYSDPPISYTQICWVRELEELIKPGGGHGQWDYTWEFTNFRLYENQRIMAAVRRLLRSDPRLTIPMSIITASPPSVQDIYEIRRYQGPGQSMVFVDYVAVGNDVYLVYNVEKFRQVKYFPQPICYSQHFHLNIKKDALENWREEVLFRGLHGKDLWDTLDVGAELVEPLLGVLRRGDLLIIGNSPLTGRIPFHAIPIGKDKSGQLRESEVPDYADCDSDGEGRYRHDEYDEEYDEETRYEEDDGQVHHKEGEGQARYEEDGKQVRYEENEEQFHDEESGEQFCDAEEGSEGSDDLPFPELTCQSDAEIDDWVTLGQYVDVVYSHGILVTKQAIQRMDRFKNRPKIPTGMNRGCFCSVPTEDASLGSQKATRTMLQKLTSRFCGDRMSLYAEPTGITATELRQQAMRTVDFLHYQGEISINPENDRSENTTLRMTEDMTLSAKDIYHHLQFQMGCSPLVSCIGEQPEQLDPGARITDIPDGISPAFLQAGASSVVTTLWPVPSHIADRFTEVFYSNFLKRGRLDGDQAWNVAQEVRVAASVVQRETGEGNGHWASFILNGAWMRGFRPGGRIKVETGKNVKSDFVDYMQSDVRAVPPPEFGLNFNI